MTFDLDAANRDHIARHSITPEECEETYRNGPLVVDSQERKNEERLLCLGKTDSGRLITFVITDRRGSIRFVTAHPMHGKQREIYARSK